MPSIVRCGVWTLYLTLFGVSSFTAVPICRFFFFFRDHASQEMFLPNSTRAGGQLILQSCDMGAHLDHPRPLRHSPLPPLWTGYGPFTPFFGLRHPSGYTFVVLK